MEDDCQLQSDSGKRSHNDAGSQRSGHARSPLGEGTLNRDQARHQPHGLNVTNADYEDTQRNTREGNEDKATEDAREILIDSASGPCQSASTDSDGDQGDHAVTHAQTEEPAIQSHVTEARSTRANNPRSASPEKSDPPVLTRTLRNGRVIILETPKPRTRKAKHHQEAESPGVEKPIAVRHTRRKGQGGAKAKGKRRTEKDEDSVSKPRDLRKPLEARKRRRL